MVPAFSALGAAMLRLPVVISTPLRLPICTVGASMLARTSPPLPSCIVLPAVIGAIATVPPVLTMVPGLLSRSVFSVIRPPPTVFPTVSAPPAARVTAGAISAIVLSAADWTLPVIVSVPASRRAMLPVEAMAPRPVMWLPAWFSVSAPIVPVRVPADNVPAVCVTAPVDCRSSVPAGLVALPVRLMVVALAGARTVSPSRKVPAVILDRSPTTMPVAAGPPMVTAAPVSGPISTVPPAADSAPEPAKLKLSVAMLMAPVPVNDTDPATDSDVASMIWMPVPATRPPAPMVPMELVGWVSAMVVPAVPLSVPTVSGAVSTMPPVVLSTRAPVGERLSVPRLMLVAVGVAAPMAPRCKVAVLSEPSTLAEAGPLPVMRAAGVKEASSTSPVALLLSEVVPVVAVLMWSACSDSVPPVVTANGVLIASVAPAAPRVMVAPLAVIAPSTARLSSERRAKLPVAPMASIVAILLPASARVMAPPAPPLL